MEPLRTPLRHYAWGSDSTLAAFQGRPAPSERPEAELWAGAHPSDPSTLARDGRWRGLDEVVAADPARELGADVVAGHGPRLPFLLKVLAAARPLSLQVHPDAAQAAAGYADEQDRRVPMGARERRYVDPYPKPELLVALTEFEALCGFRPPAESAAVLERLAVAPLAPTAAALRAGDLRGAFDTLLPGPGDAAGLVTAVGEAAAQAGDDDPDRDHLRWVARLADAHPGDMGVVVTLLLRYLRLTPGQGVYQQPRTLHAYLRGTGIEILGSSDNVLRGGLTPKHVDVPELRRVLAFAPEPPPVVGPVTVTPGVSTWPVPVGEFALYRIRVDDTAPVSGGVVPSGPRVLLCVEGTVTAKDATGELTLGRGEAAWAAAAVGEVALSGHGEAYLATVGT